MSTARGTVYYIQHREVSSSKPHYLVVLNLSPESAQYIVFGVVTSGIELARQRIEKNNQPASTLVTITPSDYQELDHDSVVDCNTPVKFSKWEFDTSYSQISANQHPDMPEHICEAIVAGVLASSMVSQKIKNLLKAVP